MVSNFSDNGIVFFLFLSKRVREGRPTQNSSCERQLTRERKVPDAPNISAKIRRKDGRENGEFNEESTRWCNVQFAFLFSSLYKDLKNVIRFKSNRASLSFGLRFLCSGQEPVYKTTGVCEGFLHGGSAQNTFIINDWEMYLEEFTDSGTCGF